MFTVPCMLHHRNLYWSRKSGTRALDVYPHSMVKKQCLVDFVELLQGFGPYTVVPAQLGQASTDEKMDDRFVLTNVLTSSCLQYLHS